MKCEISHVHLLTFDQYTHLYNPNPYQDRDSSHHSRKFPHVCFQAVLTHTPRVCHYRDSLMFLHVDYVFHVVLKLHQNGIVPY